MRYSDNTLDWYFGLPLWLQTPCAGQVLWAWNEWHLDWMERYVAADLRERTPNINMSLASRLPRWIKSAKNRDEVLKEASADCGPSWPRLKPCDSRHGRCV